MDDHTDQLVDNKTTDAEVIMLPGFRFHPTDEELVGFYLKKKIQHRVLPIELIKQVDIYKHDPWDLPNLAPSGEKEWYFYCPRDRKYKNSTRPNRVTGSGFWKATGTDRPIYSSDNYGSSNGQCIGLKKSLVFYRGRAAKGIKTDWMMHEFRLPNEPAAADQSNNKKQIQDHKNLQLPPNDAWAICRIFKKTSSVAQRAISHSWEVSSLIQDHRSTSDFFAHSNQFDQPAAFSTDHRFETPLSYRSLNQSAAYKLPSCNNSPFPFMDFTNNNGFMFSSTDSPDATRVEDAISKNCSVSVGGFGASEQLQPFIDNFPMINQYYGVGENNNELQGVGFPLSLPADEWKLNMAWDSPPACHSESTTYSTNSKCHDL